MADKPNKGAAPTGPLKQHQEYARTGKVPPGPTPNSKKPGP